MSQAEHRYDRLAVRLSLIISRLLAGETLSVNKLAVEFGVSVRTLRRDFRERLMYLNLEYRHGHCRLLSDPGMAQRAPGTLSFMRNVGLHDVFPETDLRLVNTLTDSEGISPCLVWQGGAESASVRPASSPGWSIPLCSSSASGYWLTAFALNTWRRTGLFILKESGIWQASSTEALLFCRCPASPPSRY